MMRHVIQLVCVVCLLINMWIPAAAAKHLKVGDRLPDITFIHLINYPKPAARASDFRGKVLLLDFWSTGCTSCVASWPKLERLQQEFAGRVQFLLINPWQNESIVRSLIEKRSAAGVVNLTLPTVCDDRTLLEFFEITTVPHLVWVDATGVIRAITEGSELTSVNLQAMLEGRVTAQQKEVFVREANSLPVAPDDRVLWQSTFSSYRRGIRSTMDAFARSDMGYFMRILNWPARDLYRYAYSRSTNRYGYLRFVPHSQVRLASRDSTRQRGGAGLTSDTATFYCYELVSGRPSTLPMLQARMQHDLQGQFPWKAQWEKQVRRCIVVSVTDTAMLRYVDGNYVLNITDVDFQVNRYTITELIQYLEDNTSYGYGAYPIVDETHYHGRIGGIDLNVNVGNFEALRKALQPHGLILQLADRTVDILVIRDREESNDR